MRPRQIYVFSSTNALHYAENIAGILQNDGHDARAWPSLFWPSSLTFEALEEVAHSLHGAVFVASPDDIVVPANGDLLRAIPRTNVMLELSYFAAILSRRRVLLAAFAETHLPTDYRSLTYVSLGRFANECTSNRESSRLPEDACERIGDWAASLGRLADGCAVTKVAHGYSGKWNLDIIYHTWNRLPSTKAHASNSSELFLFLEQDGIGHGMGNGRVSVSIGKSFVEFDSTDVFNQVEAHADGSLDMRSKQVCRRLVRKVIEDGTGDMYEAFSQEVRGPVDTVWHFRPDGVNRLTGSHTIKNGSDVIVESEIVMTRFKGLG